MSRIQLNPNDHPVGTRCLVSRGMWHHHTDLAEIGVIEWSPAGNASINYVKGSQRWTAKSELPWVVEVLPTDGIAGYAESLESDDDDAA